MQLKIPHVAVTRYEHNRAQAYAPYCNRVCSLSPEGMDIPLQFLSVRIAPDSLTAPETNECAKIFYITGGAGSMEVERKNIPLRAGETIWLPKGSVHIIKTEDRELSLLVIKER